MLTTTYTTLHYFNYSIAKSMIHPVFVSSYKHHTGFPLIRSLKIGVVCSLRHVFGLWLGLFLPAVHKRWKVFQIHIWFNTACFYRLEVWSPQKGPKHFTDKLYLTLLERKKEKKITQRSVLHVLHVDDIGDITEDHRHSHKKMSNALHLWVIHCICETCKRNLLLAQK